MQTQAELSEQAESALLSWIYYYPERCHEIIWLLRPDDFGAHRAQAIFKAFLHIFSTTAEVRDIHLLVVDYLRKNHPSDFKELDAFLIELHEFRAFHVSGSVNTLVSLIKEGSYRRKLDSLGDKLKLMAADNSQEILTSIDTAHQALLAIPLSAFDSNLIPFYKAGEDYIQELKDQRELPEIPALQSGFKDLDQLINGFKLKDLVIVGARPSIGKTTFALNLALSMSLAGHKVGVLSLEMSTRDITIRMLANISSIPSYKFYKKSLTEDEMKTISGFHLAAFQNLTLLFDDGSNISSLILISKVRMLKVKHGIDVVFIDYLSLINPGVYKTNRHERYADISRTLKTLARELNILIVLLSQLTRETEGKEPTLASLRETGALEQDADVVLLLHRNRHEEETHTTVNVAKHRNGPTGYTTLRFQPEFYRFEDIP